jgi:hypothetical protein
MMDNWGWNKDKHYTWYNQWDFKTPRTYRERYGVDYKRDENFEDEDVALNRFIVVVLLLILIYGGLLWTS